MAIRHLRSTNPTTELPEMLQALAVLKQAFTTAVREGEWLRQELTTARQREQDYREQLAWFRRRLECLLQASPAPVPARTPPSVPVPQTARRAHIEAWLQAIPVRTPARRSNRAPG